MRGQVIAGLVCSGAVVLACIAAAVARMRNSPAAQRRAAGQLARSAGLALPPELAVLIGIRVRRRALAALWVTAPFLAAYLFWYGYVAQGYLDSANFPAAIDRVRWPALAAPASLALLSAGTAAGHAYDVACTRVMPRPRLARLSHARLRDAVPPVTTWEVRLVSLLPAVAWIAGLTAPAHARLHHAVPVPLWACLLAAAGAVAVTAAVERLQLSVLRGRQLAATPEELAFDDASLDFPMLAAGLSCAAAIVLISPLLSATRGSHYGQAVLTGVLAVSFGVPALLLVLRAMPRAQRYYKKQYPASLPVSPAPAAGGNPAS